MIYHHPETKFVGIYIYIYIYMYIHLLVGNLSYKPLTATQKRGWKCSQNLRGATHRGQVERTMDHNYVPQGACFTYNMHTYIYAYQKQRRRIHEHIHCVTETYCKEYRKCAWRDWSSTLSLLSLDHGFPNYPLYTTLPKVPP